MSILVLILTGAFLGQAPVPPKRDLSIHFLIERGEVGLCKDGGWAVLEILVDNPTPEAIEGNLTVEVPMPHRERVKLQTYISPVQMPPQSRRRYRVPIYVDVSPNHGEATLRVGFEGVSGMPVRTRTLIPIDRIKADRLYLVVSPPEGDSGFGYLMRRRQSRFGSTKGAMVVYARPEGLPSDKLALKSLDAIILSRIALWSLTAEQQEALIAYALSGGNLILATSRSGIPHQPTLLDDVLPAIPTSYTQLEAWKRLSLIFGDGESVPGPIAIQTLDVKPSADFVIEESQSPVWVERRLGRGRVVVIAFDLVRGAMPKWSSMDSFIEWLVLGREALPMMPKANRDLVTAAWSTAFDSRRRSLTFRSPSLAFMNAPVEWQLDHHKTLPKTAEADPDPVRGGGRPGRVGRSRLHLTSASLRHLPSLEPVLEEALPAIPPTAKILSLVLGYLILIVPVNYIFWRVRRRLEWAWITAVLLAVLSTGGVVAWGMTKGQPPVRIWELDLERGLVGAPVRHHRTRFALTSPSKRRIDLAVAPGVRIKPREVKGALLGEWSQAPTLSIAEDPGLPGYEMRRRSYHYLFSERINLRPSADQNGPSSAPAHDPERARAEIHLDWKGPPDGGILINGYGWVPIPVEDSVVSNVSVDQFLTEFHPEGRIGRWDRMSPVLDEWLRSRELDRSVCSLGSWRPVLLELLGKAVSEIESGGMREEVKAQFVFWRMSTGGQLRPSDSTATLERLQVAILDYAPPAASDEKRSLRWIPRVGSMASPDDSDRRILSDLEFIPTRPLRPGELEGLRLRLVARSRLIPPTSYFSDDLTVRLFNFETEGWDSPGGRVFTSSPKGSGFNLPFAPYVDPETGVVRVRINLKDRKTEALIRSLFPTQEEGD
ncbi:MAG: hypothetical protein O7H41_08950 [Planctomycetota bacterium]|nr:hypothetical protein [Planctomycetota bacterium]